MVPNIVTLMFIILNKITSIIEYIIFKKCIFIKILFKLILYFNKKLHSASFRDPSKQSNIYDCRPMMLPHAILESMCGHS